MLGEVDRRVVLLVVTLTSFLTPFASSSFNIALPSISKEFSLDAITMSWASLAYLLAAAMFLVPFGRLADIKGRRRVFLYGTISFTISSMLLGIYPTALTIIWLRALQGVSSAMIFGTGVAILVSVTPSREKGAILGINAATVYVGLSIGPFIGGLITETLGWRSILFVTAGIGAVAVLFMVWRLKGEWREAVGESFDLRGALVYSLMLLSIMYGFSLIPLTSSIIPILLGLAAGGVFVWVEARAEHPVLDINLFRSNRAFTFSNLAALINFSATYAVTFLISLYLQYIKGLDPEQAGLVLIASPIVQAIFSPIAGKLSDRMEPTKVAAIGMAITMFGLIPFVFLNEQTNVLIVVASLVALGFGLSVFSSPNTNAIMSSVEKRLYGVASSTLGTMRLTGQMLSLGITMIIFAVFIGRVEVVPEVYSALTGSINIAFIVFSGLCLVGILASLVSSRES
ncbi:MFS transporter [Candidatus Bathyarchaeota archaeon RBG_13_52_12]|nr:MAG: MFS transporter [Candidatus Bathyarchaeota archaeon RBG_13_52_12]